MRDSRIRKIIVTSDENEIPSDVRKEIEEREEYQALYVRTVHTRRLVALKRYESPPANSRQRCTETLRQRIEWLEAQGAFRSEETTKALPVQSLRYGLAAACAAVLAMHVLGLNRVSPIQSLVTQSDLQKRHYVSFPEFLSAPDPFRTVPTLPSVIPIVPPQDISEGQPIPRRRSSTSNPPLTFVNQ